MKTLLFFISYLFCFEVISQGNVGPSNVVIPKNNPGAGVIDGVYEKKDVLAKKRAIPLEHVRESDYIWGKRTWSYIDLREKVNHPLYYPHETLDKSGSLDKFSQGRYSLYYVLANALDKGYIIGYADKIEGKLGTVNIKDLDGGDAFIFPFDKSGVGELLGKKDLDPNKIPKQVLDNGVAKDVYIKKGADASIKEYLSGDPMIDQVDPVTETTDPTQAEVIDPTQNILANAEFRTYTLERWQPKQVIKYFLKEDWFFDKERSVLDVRIIGIAPVVFDDSSKMNEKILFWVYFPQVRDVLKNYYAYDAKSTVGGNTFDHLFMTRRFNAVVYKESSLYDRKVEDYRFGADDLYESDKVKNTIRTFEHDVWNF
jgi:gliding motility associated protien GldN